MYTTRLGLSYSDVQGYYLPCTARSSAMRASALSAINPQAHDNSWAYCIGMTQLILCLAWLAILPCQLLPYLPSPLECTTPS